MPPFVTACFDRCIDETLEVLQSPRPPVVRSCHIGNNTANNWAWLSLAMNTRQVQYDHTCYGVDELSAPWTVLANHGYLAFCINAQGEQVPEAVGEHINDHIQRFDRRRQGLLNHGLVGTHREHDLVTHHLQIAARLAAQCNDSTVATQTSEIVRMEPLLRSVLRDFERLGRLGDFFDRWACTKRTGGVVMVRIGSFTQDADGVEVRDVNGGILFRGSTGVLIDRFFANARAISARLHTGVAPERLDYPWESNMLTYLLPAIEEYSLQPSRTNFWHAGGSASCYYIRAPQMEQAFNRLVSILTTVERLPVGANVTMIPTFVAQLFATNTASAAALDDVMEVWGRALSAYPAMVQGAVAEMCSGTDPSHVAREFAGGLTNVVRESLRRGIEAFNTLDVHNLPIAHIGNLRHPTYNKYGLPQECLIDRPIIFPSRLASSTWGEAELLCRVLAELVRDQRPAPTAAGI